MASAAVQSSSGTGPVFQKLDIAPQQSSKKDAEQELHHVRTALNYYKPAADGSPPAPSYVGRPETYDRPFDPVEVTVTDIAGSEDKYTLDSHGFQIYKFPSAEKDFVNDEKLQREYYPETEQLLKEATGASKVFIFDHTIRRQPKDAGRTSNDPNAAAAQLRGPVRRVHIDQSYRASLNRVAHHLPDEAAELLKGRVQIINVWRPIRPIFKDPLAVADAHSVPDEDLVGVPLIYPDRAGETYAVRPNVEHRWYYRYGQTEDLVTLIKCFDSKTDGRARRVPHTAFTNPETEGREPRESIEIRALVFHPEDRD